MGTGVKAVQLRDPAAAEQAAGNTRMAGSSLRARNNARQKGFARLTEAK